MTALTDYYGLSVLDDDNPSGAGGNAIQDNFKTIALHSGLYANAYTGSDMGAKVNAAIADLPAGGGTILLPNGAHTFSTGIVIDRDSVWLQGAGSWRRRTANFYDAATTLFFTGAGNAIRVGDGTNGITGTRLTDFQLQARNVTTEVIHFEDKNVQHNSRAALERLKIAGKWNDEKASGIYLGKSNDFFVIRECLLRYFDIGIEAAGFVNQVLLDFNHIGDCNTGLKLVDAVGPSTGFHSRDCTYEGCDVAGVDIGDGRNVTFDGCMYEGSTSLTVPSVRVGNTGGSTPIGIVFENCYWNCRSSEYPIQVWRVEGLEVTNCFAQNINGTALIDNQAESVSRIRLSGNQHKLTGGAVADLITDTTGVDRMVDDDGITWISTGLVIPSGTTPSPAQEGAVFLDTDAGVNGTLKIYSNSGWRTIQAL
jgi:hypothetical protein